ncbi:MAG: hypothetical protein DRP32_01740 [Thermotogae bacterium]|uniref:hypothetical protein n=1 Tax=Kosmotoga sp. TaxID=1955248 RepID=UPI000F220E4E|nr:hypothetical protein [Kosmotoga sp.]MBO8165596.1 hypothetical protein [Kosmotoga sp.]MCD6160428.1 hypothetical protein [Kosmotoga sp.]RKX50705.1 MAG: hypothetical protein DRP32_01740 [Thermotogota bacterium]
MTDLIEKLREFNVEEIYLIEGEEVPFYTIITKDPEELMKFLEERDDFEGDVAVLSPGELESLKEAKSEIAVTVMNAIEKGKKLL